MDFPNRLNWMSHPLMDLPNRLNGIPHRLLNLPHRLMGLPHPDGGFDPAGPSFFRKRRRFSPPTIDNTKTNAAPLIWGSPA